jgi:GntR family transcriptional regulator
MRLWLSKNSKVPLVEQLTTQVVLGIVSGDLKPGERLPSTRELARRLRIHPNTAGAAYRELARRGWVAPRRGSGIYVRPQSAARSLGPELKLDHLISNMFREARAGGYSLKEIQSRVKHWLELQPPDHFLVIEPDAELRKILVAELKAAVRFPVSEAAPEECADAARLAGAAPVALYAKAEVIRGLLPSDVSCALLHTRSIPAALRGEKPPAADALITVVSSWPEFLKWARTILVAAGVDQDALSFRDARVRGWQKALSSSALVIADALTARRVPATCPTRVFHLIADSSLAELRSFEGFFSMPGPTDVTI